MFRVTMSICFLIEMACMMAAVQGTVQLTGRQLLALASITSLTILCGCGRSLADVVLKVFCYSMGQTLATTTSGADGGYDLGYDPAWPTAPAGSQVIDAYQQQPLADSSPLGLPAPTGLAAASIPRASIFISNCSKCSSGFLCICQWSVDRSRSCRFEISIPITFA